MLPDDFKISCEFFPPKTQEGLEHLLETARVLRLLKPEFFSVTYGAGGKSKEGTLATVDFLIDNVDVPIMPHMTCVGESKETINALLRRYKEKNITNLIALRGDVSDDAEKGMDDFSFAADLIKFIRQTTGDHFRLHVASYPEFHPEAKTPKHDLYHFKQKVAAGADRAITQYFFSLDAFLYFLDDCQKMGIDIPIIPGIIPILNWPQLVRFSMLCGTDLPTWLHKRMRVFDEDVQAMQDYGCELVTHLCEKLIKHGVQGIHFYTLNKPSLTLKICRNLGLA